MDMDGHHSPKRKRNGIKNLHALDKTVDASLSGFTSGDMSADFLSNSSFSSEQMPTAEASNGGSKLLNNNLGSSLSGYTDSSLQSPEHREYQRTHTLFESLSVHGNCNASGYEKNIGYDNKGGKKCSMGVHLESPVSADGSPAEYDDLDMELDVDEDEDKYYDNKNLHLSFQTSTSHLASIPFVLNDENINPNPSPDTAHGNGDDGGPSGFSSPVDTSQNGIYLYQDDVCSPMLAKDVLSSDNNACLGVIPRKQPGQLVKIGHFPSTDNEMFPRNASLVTDDDREEEEDDFEVTLIDMNNSRYHGSRTKGGHHRKLSVGDDDLEGIRSPLLKLRRPNSTTSKTKEGRSPLRSPSPRKFRSSMPTPQKVSYSVPVGIVDDVHNCSTTSESCANDNTLVPTYVHSGTDKKPFATSLLTSSSPSSSPMVRPYTRKTSRPVPDQSVFDTSFGSSQYSGYISSSTDDMHTHHFDSLNSTISSPALSFSRSFGALPSKQQPPPLRAPPPTPAHNHFPSANQPRCNNNNASIMSLVDNFDLCEQAYCDQAGRGDIKKDNFISSSWSAANNTSEEGDFSIRLRNRPLSSGFRNPSSPCNGLFGNNQNNRNNSLLENRLLVTMKRNESTGSDLPVDGQFKSPVIGSSDDNEGISVRAYAPVPYSDRASASPRSKSLAVTSPKQRYRRSCSCDPSPPPTIDAISFNNDFINEGILGSGTFADVYCVQEVSGDHNRFAVKKSKKQFRSKKDRNWLLNEVHTMKRLCEVPCEYIIRLVCAWQEGGYFYVQTELANKGTLSAFTNKFIAGNESIRDSTIFHVVHDLLSGLAHIHSCNIVHMDIKPANLLISEAGRIKIGDFGLACDCNRDEDGREGDIRYMAPELLQFSINIQPSVDMFSLGMTIYELCAAPIIKELPTEGEIWRAFREDRMPPLPRMVTSDALAPGGSPGGATAAVSEPAVCVQRSDSIVKAIESCLQSNPDLRPTCARMLSSWTDLWAYYPYLHPSEQLSTPTNVAKTVSNVNTAPHHPYHTRQQLRQQQGLDITVSYNEEAAELDRCRSPAAILDPNPTALFVDSAILAVPIYQPNRPMFRSASFVPVTISDTGTWLDQEGVPNEPVGSRMPPIVAPTGPGLSINIGAVGADCSRNSAVVTPVGDSGVGGNNFWQSWNPLGHS